MSWLSKLTGVDVKIGKDGIHAKVDWKKVGQNLLLGAAAPALGLGNIPLFSQAAEKIGLTNLLGKTGLTNLLKSTAKDINKFYQSLGKVGAWGKLPGIGQALNLGGMSGIVGGGMTNPLGLLGMVTGNPALMALGTLGGLFGGLGGGGQTAANVAGIPTGGAGGGMTGAPDINQAIMSILGQGMDLRPLVWTTLLGGLLARPYISEAGSQIGGMGAVSDVIGQLFSRMQQQLPEIEQGRQRVYNLLMGALPRM